MPQCVKPRRWQRRVVVWPLALAGVGCPEPDVPQIRPEPETESSVGGDVSSGTTDAATTSTDTGTPDEPHRIPPEPWVLPEGCGDGVKEPGRYDCFFPVSLSWVEHELGADQPGKPSAKYLGLDLEGDGRSELIAVQQDKQATVIRWDGQALVVGPSASSAQIYGGWRLGTAWDWDRDGRRDVTLLASGGSITMYRNLGPEGLGERSYVADLRPPEWPQADGTSAPLDVDGDGVLELVRSPQVGNPGSANPPNELVVLKSMSGQWVQVGPTFPFGPCGWISRFATGDFDEDGRDDLAILDDLQGCDPFPGSYDPEWYRVAILVPDIATGELQLAGSYPTGAMVQEGRDFIWSDDIDDDGHLDLILQVYWVTSYPELAYAVSVMRGHGDGTFDEGEVVDLTPTFPSYEIWGRADLDGDGQPEWITRDEARLWAIPRSFVLERVGALVYLHDVGLGGTTSYKASIGDMNADGIEDYVARSVTSADPGALGEGDFLMLSAP